MNKFLELTNKIISDNQIKLFLFDVDGTLIDSMIQHYTSWHKALEKFGAKITDEELSSMKGVTSDHVVEHVNRTQNLNLNSKQVSDYKEELFSSFVKTEPVKIISEIVDIVYLGEELNMNMVVCTGGTTENIQNSLSKVNLINYFSKLYTATNAKFEKFTKDYWINVASEMNVLPNNCIVFEDSKKCAEAANSAGMFSVVI